jgi:hypothetical protein
MKLINEFAFTLNILAAIALLSVRFSLKKFPRVFHSDGDGGGDGIHTDSKKRLVLIRKEG